MYYKLIRSEPVGKAVYGKLYCSSHYYNKRLDKLVERLHYVCDTLENADYLVPALTYRVDVTISPRFKRPLPILLQVPGRTGIRFHRGSRPEHSKGCILVSAETEQVLTSKWLNEKHGREETRLEAPRDKQRLVISIIGWIIDLIIHAIRRRKKETNS